MNKPIILTLIGTLALSGCATGYRAPPTQVTRFHLGQPLERTTFTVEPATSTDDTGPEFRTYADAVSAELEKQGYVRSTSDRASGYIAGVAFRRDSAGTFRERAPFSIGFGGGGFGGNVGAGAGVNVPIGGKTRALFVSELSVQLRRRSDNTVVWEGRALAESASDTAAGQPAESAVQLARALFTRFPGDSGVTISVK